jgi:uncharacterized protein YraI
MERSYVDAQNTVLSLVRYFNNVDANYDVLQRSLTAPPDGMYWITDSLALTLGIQLFDEKEKRLYDPKATGPASGTAQTSTPVGIPATTPTKSTPENCTKPSGDFAVVNVKWEDPVGGLVLRSSPSSNAAEVTVIPAAGTGIGKSECQGNWCRTTYQCKMGWSYLPYLSPKSSQVYKVTGVSPRDPEGLNIRTGPHSTYPKKSSIPYNATEVVEHICQPSPIDQSNWCLVTYGDDWGWVSGRFLTR